MRLLLIFISLLKNGIRLLVNSADWIQQIQAGNRRALARLLTAIENQQADAQAVVNTLFLQTGHAHIIGVTGAPGTGKSTLVTQLADVYRRKALRVAVIAVDPTSPFSGGAILGDRVRMQVLSEDPNVFIRSVATRGHLGGLARSVWDMVVVFDAAKYDVILVETVGAGQSEVDIVRLAHTTIVVEAPGMGDGVQAIKAGILEIADILTVNKSDHPNTAQTVRSLKTMLELGHPTKQNPYTKDKPPKIVDDTPLWIPPIVQTVATQSQGIETLIEQIALHQHHLAQYQLKAHHEQWVLQHTLFDMLQQALMQELKTQVSAQYIEQQVLRLASREIRLSEAVEAILQARYTYPDEG